MEAERADYLIRRINECPFNAANGIYAVSVEEGHAEVAADLTPDSKNIWDIPHGGLVYSLGDVASGLTVHSVHDGRAVTVSGTLNYLRSAGKTARRLTGTGRLIKRGRTMAFVQVEIQEDGETLIASGQYVLHLS